jgi:hypothetical protein
MMVQGVSFILGAWVIMGALLFRFLPGRVAAAIGLVGAWAFLPVAPYTPAMFTEPGGAVSPMHALALPTAFTLNKATAVALGCLFGAVLFDWTTLREAIRPSWYDLPIVAWCLVPLGSAWMNGLELGEALGLVRYGVLTWGVPYAMGRAYFADVEGLRTLLIAWTLGGLAYLPLCLAEFIQGPWLYDLLYGPHPYRFDGATRPFGNRTPGLPGTRKPARAVGRDHGGLGRRLVALGTAGATRGTSDVDRRDPLGGSGLLLPVSRGDPAALAGSSRAAHGWAPTFRFVARSSGRGRGRVPDDRRGAGCCGD